MTGGGVMTGGVMTGGACGGDFLAVLRRGNDLGRDLAYAACFISLSVGTYPTGAARFSDSLSGALTSGSVLADASSIESS